ncbi:alpha-ketoacid dehydrogenase subunit beta [Patescibacteria group bacterium]
MSSVKSKKITYCQALNEAMFQEMKRNLNVFVYGIGVADHKKIFGTTVGLLEEFGPQRCLDTPLCEDMMTGFGLGASLNGMVPINIHIRVDFLLLAMNQLANMVSSLRYGSGGKLKAPLVIRAIIGRGWGQGFQHSKSMSSVFAHIPGLKVVMPTTPRDAKGLLISAIRDPNPVIFIEHRWLYYQEGEVPTSAFTIPLEKGNILRKGKDLTIVAISWMNVEALRAAEFLKKRGIDIEIIDPRTITPLDEGLIINSVNKTGRCIVADYDWINCGFSGEVASRVSEKCFGKLKYPVQRMGFSQTPCPTARHLENEFYPSTKKIIRMVEKMFKLKPADLSKEKFYSYENKFKGPF